jgi:hypothetical protein
MCQCGLNACRECRARQLGRDRRKYVFTPELTAALREAYRAPNRPALVAALTRLQRRRPDWPRKAWIAEAQRLGITLVEKRAWTAEDDVYLREAAGRVSLVGMAKKLGRSERCVAARCERLAVSRRARDGYSMTDLQECFGASQQTVQGWRRRGLLGRVRELGGANGDRVADQDVVLFIRRHSSEYDLRRVDQVWFRSMAFGGDV